MQDVQILIRSVLRLTFANQEIKATQALLEIDKLLSEALDVPSVSAEEHPTPEGGGERTAPQPPT